MIAKFLTPLLSCVPLSPLFRHRHPRGDASVQRSALARGMGASSPHHPHPSFPLP